MKIIVTLVLSTIVATRLTTSAHAKEIIDFIDILPKAYYTPYMARAYRNDTVNGVSPPDFTPNQPVTRERVV